MPGCPRIKLLSLTLMILIGGCGEKKARPAQPAEIVLSSATQVDILQTMAVANPSEGGPPIHLLPVDGWRWSDVERAARSAGADQARGAVHFAVVQSHMESDHAWFELETIHGWPAVLTASRSDMGVQWHADVGPWPDDPDAKQDAKAIVKQSHRHLMRWGHRPQLPEIKPPAAFVPSD